MARTEKPAGNQEVQSRPEGSAPGKDNSIDWSVFGISFGLVAIFCILGAIWQDKVGEIGNAALDWIVADLGWIFVLATTGFVVFALVLAISRYGRIRLSRSGEGPEFSTVSWVAMMFSAGMGIGLIFFGVYEPVWHAVSTPPGTVPDPNVPEATLNQGQAAIETSMAFTFFHWGLHPWAVYAVVALALAYSTFRMGRGNLISSPFQSLSRTGDDVSERWWGKAINIWSIIGTKFGGATSLGLGALQIAGGFYILWGIGSGFGGQTSTNWVAYVVIGVLVIFAILSAVSGVGNGIKWLSNTNMVLAVLLVLFVLFAGPTIFLLDLIPQAFGSYIYNIIPMSFRTPAFGHTEWFSSWTIFYWAWWISWTPFVSTFIARVSRGRTVREFVAGVLIVPTVVSALWFVILGGAGIELAFSGQGNLVETLDANPAVAFFNLLQAYPGFMATGILVILLVAIFWVSGADASALVLATLSSRGAIEPKPWLIALWAAASAAVAIVLLAVGGLNALQTFTILIAAPFVLVMIALCYALYVDLRRDPLRASKPGPVRQHAPSPGSYAVSAQREEWQLERPVTDGDSERTPAGVGAGGGRGNGEPKVPQPAGVTNSGSGDRS